MDELPHELLSYILSFVPTHLLYPSCFLVSKGFLVGTLDEVSWQRRCLSDLQITERIPDTSWRLTYRGICPFLCTSLSFNIIIPCPSYCIELMISRWDGQCCTRGDWAISHERGQSIVAPQGTLIVADTYCAFSFVPSPSLHQYII